MNTRVCKFLSPLAIAPVALGVLAAAPPASAQPTTVTATAGPVSLPGVPVNVCVNNDASTCVATPPATTVSVTASVTVDPDAVTAPTVVQGACSNGEGVALVINTGSAGTVISGSVTVTVNGNPMVIPVNVPPTTPNQTVIISACVSPGVGIPPAPGTPGVPGVPGVPGAPGLLGLISDLLNNLLGLLGGAPAVPGVPAIPVP